MNEQLASRALSFLLQIISIATTHMFERVPVSMSFADDLAEECDEIFQTQWKVRKGEVVPDSDSVSLGNDAVKLTGTVLYADLAASTKLVESLPKNVAAEIYKSYLYCCARIIAKNDGEITAYDGDRIRAVFIGKRKNTNAADASLKIHHAVSKIVNPAFQKEYESKYKDVEIRHDTGVDTSEMFIAKTGIRGHNDLVWVGRSANYAAKLSDERDDGFRSFITENVYDAMNKTAKVTSTGVNMWVKYSQNELGITAYKSSWMRRPV